MELLGSRWREWGTEQVASNFLIARDPNGILLPYRGYRHFGGESLTKEAAFVHFFGTFCYEHGTYRQMARATAALLKGKPARRPAAQPQPGTPRPRPNSARRLSVGGGRTAVQPVIPSPLFAVRASTSFRSRQP